METEKIVNPVHWRMKAFGAHLLVSALLAASCAGLVFLLWYPSGYAAMSGVADVFWLLLGVDVVMGPLLTLVVFNTKKPRKELVRDLAMVLVLQLGALGYGVSTVFAGRPVHLVFEYDRMRVVHANEIPEEFWGRVPAGINAFPATGPTLLALRPFKDNSEQSSATFAALNGIAMSTRPELWIAFDEALPEVLKAAKPVSQLISKTPAFAAPLRLALAQAKRSEADTAYLPLAGRASFGTALLDAKTGQPVALLPLDSF